MNAGIVINAGVPDICEVREELVLNDPADRERIPPNYRLRVGLGKHFEGSDALR
jgi:hypothetical protein